MSEERIKKNKVVSVKAMWRENPSDDLVWTVCSYAKGPTRIGEECERCPHSEIDPDHGEITRGCRALAEETARYAMATLRYEGWQDTANKPATSKSETLENNNKNNDLTQEETGQKSGQVDSILQLLANAKPPAEIIAGTPEHSLWNGQRALQSEFFLRKKVLELECRLSALEKERDALRAFYEATQHKRVTCDATHRPACRAFQSGLTEPCDCGGDQAQDALEAARKALQSKGDPKTNPDGGTEG